MSVRRAGLAAVLFMVLLVAAVGCSSASGRVGGGPRPLLGHRLYVDADGRTMHGTFNCGGTLEAKERATEVVVTYVARPMAPGAASCAIGPESVTRLKAPLAGRSVIDGVDHSRVSVFDLSDMDRPASGAAAPAGDPSWSVGAACPEMSAPIEIPCGARQYRVSGQDAPVMLVQDLIGTDPPYNVNPEATEDRAPWCLRSGVPSYSACGLTVCKPVGAHTGLSLCDPPSGPYRRYITRQLGEYRLFLAASQQVDPELLAGIALSITGPISG